MTVSARMKIATMYIKGIAHFSIPRTRHTYGSDSSVSNVSVGHCMAMTWSQIESTDILAY